MALVGSLPEQPPLDARPMWREREMRSRPAPEPASRTIDRGQFPTPHEKGLPEPLWKLSGVIDETELQRQQEERMLQDESDKFEMVADLYQQELEAQELHRQELLAYINELEDAAQQEEAGEMAQVEEDNEALQDEIEALVRELRMQSLEDGLRQVEAHAHKAHQTTLKNVIEVEHEINAVHELYMQSVLEHQERILEEQERERLEGCLGSYDMNAQLTSDAKEAVEFERDQNEQRARRMAALEQAHAESALEEEAELARIASEFEEKDRIAHNADLVGSLTDGKEAMRMLFKAATEKDKEVKTELQERHDIFVAQVNEQVVHMHVEAERARRREWAKRDLSFRRSEELLHKARDIVKNIDHHVKDLDAEFQGIVERRDVWPPGPSYSQPHQRSKPRSAGARFDEEIPASERPSTAPLRQRSAKRREMLVRAGRAKAPTGFGYAIRIVFEHLDTTGKGDLDETEMLEGLRLLGLDTTDVSLASVFNESGKDASSRIDFQDFEEMVMSVIATKGTGKEARKKAAKSKLGASIDGSSGSGGNAAEGSGAGKERERERDFKGNASSGTGNLAASAAAASILEERSFELDDVNMNKHVGQ